jgi:uncharacterized membrane protein
MSYTHFFSIKNIIDTFGLFYINDYPFLMMVWDIILAIVPFFFFLLLHDLWEKTALKKYPQKILAVVIGFFWFIFLPNAAYLIVGVRHLLNFCPADSANSVCVAGTWQIMIFFIYGLLGWIFFAVLLARMRRLLAKIFSAKFSRWAVIVIIPFVSLGVLSGLTERFNSWDVFYRPLAILQNLLRYMTDWEYFRNFLVFSVGLYILYYSGEFFFGKRIK